MTKGIIYAMTTVVPGLIKIGKTGCNNFEQRMYNLEHNGYFNVAGLHRRFAIEVEDYDEKEALLDEIFSKSRVPDSELFALDIDLVIQLLSSFEGHQVYPKEESKEAAFDAATEARSSKEDWSCIPEGTYHLKRKSRAGKIAEASMEYARGKFIVKAGAHVLSVPEGQWAPEAIRNADIQNGVLMQDVSCASPSTAAHVVLGHSANGWREWHTENGKKLETFRTQ